MTTEFLMMLQWIMDYSIVLSMQLVLLLLLRPAIRHWTGAANSYRLWLLPLIWLPFYFMSRVPENLQQYLASIFYGESSAMVTGGLFMSALTDFRLEQLLASLPEFNISQSAESGMWIGLAVLWIAVVVVLLVKEVLRIVRFARYVDVSARPVSGAEADIIRGDTELSATLSLVYLKDIESPALYGLLHPVLLLPEGFLSKYDADQRHIIISHEAVHLQRRDNFWNLAACLARVLFWFNPLVHIAHHYYRLDQELSCDALALARCNETQVRHYARTLLASVARARVINHPPIIAAWENPRQLKERIQMITKHLANNGSRASAVISLLLVCLMGAGLTACATNDARAQAGAATAEARRPPPDARNQQVISRRVFSLVNEVMQLRDMGNYAAAMEKLAEIKALEDAGRLNAREQFVMWQFYANLYQAQGESREAIDSYERILAMPGLTPEQRENVQEQIQIVRAGGPTTANEVQASDVEMLPIVTIQPNYPDSAIAGDIEGWILVGFTVDESGYVMNPEVIDAEPEGVFNDSALTAIAKFKFNPRLVDGEPVAVPGVRYLFRFNL